MISAARTASGSAANRPAIPPLSGWTSCAGDASAPAAMPSRISVIWARLIVPTTTQRWCIIARTPTAEMWTAPAPTINPLVIGRFMFSGSLLHDTLAQQSLRTEDQHHDQQREGDQVAQLVGRRDAQSIEK